MKIKVCVFLLCIMTCFSGYAFASGKSAVRVEKKMLLVYKQVMQSELDDGVKALVVLSLRPAFMCYRATAAYEHMDWPWEDDNEDDEDECDGDDCGDDDTGNEYTCIFDAIYAMITTIKECDSSFSCIFVSVFTMVFEIASCSE